MNARVGLFPLSLDIGNQMPGAPHARLTLGVYTPAETVSGLVLITQATNPPLEVASNVTGTYTYMTVMPNDTHILIVLTGYPVVKWPQQGGIGPVLQPNFEARIVLDKSWREGVANYKYQDNDGNWHEVQNVPVKGA